jgi:peptide-methionine (S)-S-oxide reductase
MYDLEIPDPLFREAIAAMDQGDIATLRTILEKHPKLVNTRLSKPDEGYFKHPYLLWFVADNPIRVGKLPPNIVEIADLILKKMQENKSSDYQHQVGYACGLVITGRVPRECGVQIRLTDLLIDAGAGIGGSVGALANGNLEAAEHMIKRGEKLTLTAAVGLGRTDDIPGLTMQASKNDLQEALVCRSFFWESYYCKIFTRSGCIAE